MSKKFYAIERFVLPKNEVSLKITPCSSREVAQNIIGSSEAQKSAVSSFGAENLGEKKKNERL